MKNIMLLFAALILCLSLSFPAPSLAEDFLGAPVITDGKIVEKTGVRLETKVPLSHDGVLKFYRKALKDEKDIKFRDWKDSTYIEDDGKRPWHSITILKGQGTETQVVILKDNWTWIVGTLILRFVAVFVVLLVLYVGMNVSGKIINSATKKAAAKKAEAAA
ncbi:MAG: hypothetical protein ABII06_00710 [Pseudomonadota bacterium]